MKCRPNRIGVMALNGDRIVIGLHPNQIWEVSIDNKGMYAVSRRGFTIKLYDNEFDSAFKIID